MGRTQKEVRVRRLLGYLLAWLAAAIYLWRFVDRGWVPHDDGMLAQIAERILAGELPHRDFDDPYTGGLGYLHALSFLAFGDRILSMRIVLFLVAMIWIPAVFVVARRFVPPVSAAFVTAAAIVWTIPNYFASMPSYYNLFFATWGTAALLRHIDTDSRIWLFIAGLCGGLSFLVKSSGLYFIGAALIFLLYREQLQHRSTEERSLAVFVAKTVVGLLFVMGLAGLVVAHPGTTEVLHFFVPGAALIAVLLWTEWSEGRGTVGERIRGAALLILPFLIGVLLPVTSFITPYVVTGSVSAWYEGVFVSPRSRFSSATAELPPFITMMAVIPYGLVLIAGAGHWRVLGRRWSIVMLAAAALIAPLAIAGGAVDTIYRSLWYSVRHLVLPVVLTGCLLLVRGEKIGLSLSRRQELYLLVLLAALMPLVQIPFSAAIYFCYAAPFLLLGALAVARSSSMPHHWVHPVVLGGYLLFAVIWTNTNYVWSLGAQHVRYNFVGTSILPRAGIRMTEGDRSEYSTVVALIQQINGGKRYIYAGPDCPEVYFLSGTRNPTRTLYEFMRPPRNAKETLDLLERQEIDVVVINRSPGFSGPLDRRLARAFQRRYPYRAEVGRFLVRWRL
jgi:Dolichyl-phosphate-mannose-protein mannosyltransferase